MFAIGTREPQPYVARLLLISRPACTVSHFAARHPAIAFTHILPGQVLTKGDSHVELGWLFAPLAWVLGYIKRVFSFTLDECAQYMLYGLLDPEPTRGLDNATSPTALNKVGVLHGVRMKGYGGSDASVAGLIAYTEKVQ
ncbi:hypothetical protein B0H14DRAFT_3857766 [Mycena olivaceomarginata]|nr:hypothetical protein B0H14DRAFT_3857766 [Mycena olivaceomarginata]